MRPGAGPRGLPPARRRIPPPITDLAQELWQRATAAAVLELKHGRTARDGAARTQEVQGLRTQLSALRDQLERAFANPSRPTCANTHASPPRKSA